MKIEKELEREKTAHLSQLNQPSETAKRLLLAEHNEERELLRRIGMDKTAIAAEDKLGSKIEIERHEKEYGKVFTRKQIRTLCLAYRLKFREARNYKGGEDSMLGVALKNFVRDYKISPDRASFYIMAPAENFKENLKINWSKPFEVNADPVLFYAIDHEHFRMVHSWGKDLTVARLLKGFRYRNALNLSAWWGLTASFVLGAIINLLLGTLIVPAMAFGVITFFVLLLVSTDSDNEHVFTEHNWQEK